MGAWGSTQPYNAQAQQAGYMAATQAQHPSYSGYDQSYADKGYGGGYQGEPSLHVGYERSDSHGSSGGYDAQTASPQPYHRQAGTSLLRQAQHGVRSGAGKGGRGFDRVGSSMEDEGEVGYYDGADSGEEDEKYEGKYEGKRGGGKRRGRQEGGGGGYVEADHQGFENYHASEYQQGYGTYTGYVQGDYGAYQTQQGQGAGAAEGAGYDEAGYYYYDFYVGDELWRMQYSEEGHPYYLQVRRVQRQQRGCA